MKKILVAALLVGFSIAHAQAVVGTAYDLNWTKLPGKVTLSWVNPPPNFTPVVGDMSLGHAQISTPPDSGIYFLTIIFQPTGGADVGAVVRFGPLPTDHVFITPNPPFGLQVTKYVKVQRERDRQV